jgi:hypothetical protein
MAHRHLLFLWDFGPDRVHLSHSFLLDHPKSMPMYTISKIVPLASNFMSFFNFQYTPKYRMWNYFNFSRGKWHASV